MARGRLGVIVAAACLLGSAGTAYGAKATMTVNEGTFPNVLHVHPLAAGPLPLPYPVIAPSLPLGTPSLPAVEALNVEVAVSPTTSRATVVDRNGLLVAIDGLLVPSMGCNWTEILRAASCSNVVWGAYVAGGPQADVVSVRGRTPITSINVGTLGGNDTVRARDGVHQSISCGAGSDLAIVDTQDVVRDCETVQVG